MEEADLEQRILTAVKLGHRGGCTSFQVCSALGLERSSREGEEVAEILSKLSMKPSSWREPKRKSKPLLRVPQPNNLVAYVYWSFFFTELREPLPRRCYLCGESNETWRLLGGDYTGSHRVALVRQSLPQSLCEKCFRTHLLGSQEPECTGLAVLPGDYFLGVTETKNTTRTTTQATSNTMHYTSEEEVDDETTKYEILDKMQEESESEPRESFMLIGAARDKILQETVNEVRSFGSRGGTWHDIIERVRLAVLPNRVENLKEVVQYCLHVSSSKTLKSKKPLLRRAMVSFDGSVQILFVAKEYIDPKREDASCMACGLRMEIAEQSVPGALFGLLPYTTFKIIIEDFQLEESDQPSQTSPSSFSNYTSMGNIREGDPTQGVDDEDEGRTVVQGAKPRFEIIRRYSDFLWLRDELVSWHGDEAMVPPLPKKRLVGRFHESFLEARLHALEHFLSIVVTHPVLHKADALHAFFKNAPLEQVKPEYESRAPQRLIRKRDRRSSVGVALSGKSGLELNPSLVAGGNSYSLSSLFSFLGGSSSLSKTFEGFLLQSGLSAREKERLRLLLSASHHSKVKKLYKGLERIADCKLAFAKDHEERAKALKFLAAAEVPELEKQSSEEETLMSIGTTSFSEIPLTESGMPNGQCARALVELFSSLSRMDVLAGTANRAAFIRMNSVRMQLKEWHRSLQEYSCWFENRLHSSCVLENSIRNKQGLFLDGSRRESHEESEESENNASGDNTEIPRSNTAKSDMSTLQRAKGLINELQAKNERIRNDAGQEAVWMQHRNQQEVGSFMVSFVEQQIEHARQMSKMWQEFLPQLFDTLDDHNKGQSAKKRTSTWRHRASTEQTIEEQEDDTDSQAAAKKAYVPGGLFQSDDFGSVYGFSDDEVLDEEDNTSAASDESAAREWEINPTEISLGECVGQGSFGQVFKGIYHGRRVAVKQFASYEMSEKALKDFRREACVMKGLPPHDNVIKFFGMCSRPGNVCLIMELVESGSLLNLLLSDQDPNSKLKAKAADRRTEHAVGSPGPPGTPNITVRRKRKAKSKKEVSSKSVQSESRPQLEDLDEKWQLKLALGAARGLLVLHQSKPQILHRDVKTSNMLVSVPDLTVKVCDFGLARFKLDNQSVKSFVGTASWVAPEVILSRSEGYSTKADVYSFAIVLWQIYARTLPYPNMHATQVMYHVSRENMRPKMPKNVPAVIDALIRKCWAPNPEERPEFSDIVETLESLYLDGHSNAKEETSMYDRSELL